MDKNYVSLEGAASFNDIVNRMQGELEKGGYGMDNWLIGKGYDESILAEKHTPEAYVLNEVSGSVPVVIMDKNEAHGCANTVALSSAKGISHHKGSLDKNALKAMKDKMK